jgi:hypothetical protein
MTAAGKAMTQRHGPTATTSTSVLDMLGQAQAGGTRFSHTERVLYTACEFWVATVNRSLVRHLGIIPKVILRDAEAAFAAIEIPTVADILRDARVSLLSADTPAAAGEILVRLQRTLEHVSEPVDNLIGKFAIEQTWSRLKRPTFQAIESAAAAQAEIRGG